jgi:hypothetical protein
MTIYRTHAAQLIRLERLEAVKKAAEEFLDALVTDPGYPGSREEALSAALKAADEEIQP